MTSVNITCINDIYYILFDKGLSQKAIDQWVESYNSYITSQRSSSQYVIPKEAKQLAQGDKVFIDTLVLHPLKITTSFMTTPFPREDKFDIFRSNKYLILKMLRLVPHNLVFFWWDLTIPQLFQRCRRH